MGGGSIGLGFIPKKQGSFNCFPNEAVTKFPYLLIRRQCRGNIDLLHEEEKADGDTACGVDGDNHDVEHQCFLNDSCKG